MVGGGLAVPISDIIMWSCIQVVWPAKGIWEMKVPTLIMSYMMVKYMYLVYLCPHLRHMKWPLYLRMPSVWLYKNIVISPQWRHRSFIASQITGNTVVCSPACAAWKHRKTLSSTCWPFVKGIHRCLVDLIHKGSVMRKASPCHGVVMLQGGVDTMK